MKLLIGGSPCTHWSIAQTKSRETEPSGIGWELFENYLIALEKFKPDYFLYENNKSMSASIRAEITKRFGFEPVCINSALVSAQNRQRLYWCGKRNPNGTYSKVYVKQPEDKGIFLRDILDSGFSWREKSHTIDANYFKGGAVPLEHQSGKRLMGAEPINITTGGKSQCLRATYYKDGIRNMVGNTVDRKTCVAELFRIGAIDNCDVVVTESNIRCQRKNKKHSTVQGSHVSFDSSKSQTMSPSHIPKVFELSNEKTFQVYEVLNGLININGKQYPIKLADGFYIIRKLTVAECKRIQTVPDWYEFPVSDTQAYKMLGNGWTVDVISHILSNCINITAEPLDVLSMYDGMACGHIALDKMGAQIIRYQATEIDKYAIKTACHNFPYIIQLGDAFQVREW